MGSRQLEFDFDAPVVIKLTRGKQAIVSPEDADLTELAWYVIMPAPNKFYVMRRIPKTHNEREYLHRLVLSRMLGRDLLPTEDVDHTNMNPLDNRRENLRLATRSQNLANTKTRSNNTSGFKGVYFDKTKQKWRAIITVNKEIKRLGRFDTPEEAHAAYCEAAKHYYGEFARFE